MSDLVSVMLELLFYLFCSLHRVLLATEWSRGAIMCWWHLLWQPPTVLVVLLAPVIVAHLSHDFMLPVLHAPPRAPLDLFVYGTLLGVRAYW